MQSIADPKGFRVMEDVRNACLKIVKDVNGIDVPVVMTFTSIKMRPNPDNPSGNTYSESRGVNYICLFWNHRYMMGARNLRYCAISC